MTETLTYETAAGELDTITRDEFHAQSDGVVTGYDNPDTQGVENKVRIPTRRVVRIDG